MASMEVFFDYACPYCYRAHVHLVSLLPSFPCLEILWRPCESHPRPERYGPHSDLMIMGMYFAEENHIGIMEYHGVMYAAVHSDGIDVESIPELSAYVSGLADPAAFAEALVSGRYTARLASANAYAYGRSGVWVVPAYRLGGNKLDPIEDVGVNRAHLEKFIRSSI